MNGITTGEATWLLPFTQKEIAEKCKNGEIYAYKTPDKHFAKWIIPIDSLRMYVQRNPDLVKYVQEIEPQYTRCCSLASAFQVIVRRTWRNDFTELYSQENLSDIFGPDFKSIEKELREAIPFFPFVKRVKYPVPVKKIFNYLMLHPNMVQTLTDRHTNFLNEGSPTGSLIQHLLMIFTYYDKE